MKKISFFLCTVLLTTSCYDTNSILETSNSSTEIVDIDDSKKPSISVDFISLCSSTNVEPMKIDSDLTVWGYEPLAKDKDRKCEKLNLNDYSKMDCQYSKDLIQSPGIHLYKDSEGWFKFIYETSDICINSLETYAAQSEES